MFFVLVLVGSAASILGLSALILLGLLRQIREVQVGAESEMPAFLARNSGPMPSTSKNVPVRASRSAAVSKVQLRTSALTIIEIVVVIAIVIALVVVALPVVRYVAVKKNKGVALKTMRDFGSALSTHFAQNDNRLPAEDAKGNDTWRNAAKPDEQDVWYNALPRLLGRKTVGDYAASPREFYTAGNILFLPGATYPESDRKLREPLFAIAMNAKLQRRDEQGKKVTKLSEISVPAKTVALFERGLPDEPRTLEVQTNKSYDGRPKGSARAFVGRYGGEGFVQFLDGHAEAKAAEEMLTETGRFPYPQTDVIWTRTPEEDPNLTDVNPSADS